MYTWRSFGEILWKEVSFIRKSEGRGRAKAFTDGLTKLFAEIKEKPKIADLTVEYQKFAEWLRIE